MPDDTNSPGVVNFNNAEEWIENWMGVHGKSDLSAERGAAARSYIDYCSDFFTMVVYFETPVAFPLIGENHRVYVVNDRDGTIHERTTERARSTTASYRYDYDEAGAISMSGVSELSNGSILTTSPVADRIIAITLLKSDCEPVLIHLDLHTECSLFTESVVALKAFSCCNGSAIQLVIVDASAVILTLRFTADTLTSIAIPCSNGPPVDVRCLCTGEIMPNLSAQAAFIRSSMVAFVSSDVVLVSSNPYFLAVDLFREQVQPWSKSKCLEDMKARASGLRSLMSKGAELLLGKWDAILIDMNPVAAVCTADNDANTIFTLHSDGIVRRWTVTDSSLLPYSVHDLSAKHIPDPSTWSSDAVKSTYLTARMYENLSRIFVLAIHVQTVVSIPDSSEGWDESLRAPSKHVLIAVDGSTDDDTATTHSIRLGAPAEATALVDLKLDPQSERCQMRALFRTESSGIFCTYSASTLSILSREPSVTGRDYFLDGVAQQERERIQQLSFGQACNREESCLEDVLVEVDRRYLQHLFRPSFPRGNGTVLPPSAKHIRRAMQKLMQSHSTNLDCITASIELEVMRFNQEWRKREHHRIISMTPLKKQRSPVTPGSIMAYAGNSIYDALEDDVDEVEMDVEETDETTHDKQKELQEHERRWCQLLIQICDEEELERAPVAMSVAVNSADAAVIVRPGCVCVVTANLEGGQNVLSMLDKVALTLLDTVIQDEGLVPYLRKAEQFIWESVSRGHLALEPDDAQNFKDMLGRDLALPPLDQDSQKLVRELRNVRDEQWLLLLRNAPLQSSLPGLCLLSAGGPSRSDLVSPHNPVLGIQSRLAAGSLVVRGADSARRVALGRYLVLSDMESNAADAALRMYLHAIAVMGVAARTVPFPPVASLDLSLQHLQLDKSVGVPAKEKIKGF
jgi:hypothetical protein